MGYFNYLYFYNWSYLIFMLPCIILTLICQAKVNSAYNKYSKVKNSRNMTGAQAAEYLLRHYGVSGVKIEMTSGRLSDHFDPRTNIIILSQDVYNSPSIAAVGIACHEAGHAVQHATGYFPNKLRGVLVPIANIGSRISWILIMLGFISSAFESLLYLGIICFSASVLFTLVTLPVEFNASARALACIRETNLLTDSEYKGAKSTLQAAAMTYVAAAATAVLQLLRLITIANRRR